MAKAPRGPMPKNKLAGVVAKGVAAGLKSANTVSTKLDSPYDAQDKKWKTERALRTIKEAEEFKKDKALMKDVKAMAKCEMDALKKIG